MTDTPAISRTLGPADEFARRMRIEGQPAAGRDDPLAELARLVGQDDPFRNLFPQPASTAMAQTQRENLLAFEHDLHDPSFTGNTASAPETPVPVTRSAYPQVSIDPGPVEQSPDVWAQGGVEAPEPRRAALGASAPGEARGAGKRTMVVLAAVMALTGGGLAAGLLLKPAGGASAGGSAGAPTIMAAAGPSKVAVDNTAVDAEAATENSTLLDKNKGDGTASATVVTKTEQPVDLAQAVKAVSPATTDDPRPVASSPFPEPKKVRTVMVRPDGSIITGPKDGSAVLPRLAATSGSVADSQASLAFDPQTAMPMATPDQPPAASPPAAAAPKVVPATPKTTARVPTTPKVADVEPASASEPPAAAERTPAKPKPVKEASATPAGDAGSGAYAVQLGAPPSEAEANATAARFQKKYADQLGAYQPSIVKATSGTKSVYRIRVGNLSQDAAKTLCSKLQTGGGACFVVRN